MKKIILTLSLTFLITQLSMAGVLFGTVKDNGKPVKDAKVQIWGKQMKTKTNAKGEFRFNDENLKVGNRYAVKVKVEGYTSSLPFATEIFEDEEDMDPIEIEISKEEEVDYDAMLTNDAYHINLQRLYQGTNNVGSTLNPQRLYQGTNLVSAPVTNATGRLIQPAKVIPALKKAATKAITKPKTTTK